MKNLIKDRKFLADATGIIIGTMAKIAVILALYYLLTF